MNTNTPIPPQKHFTNSNLLCTWRCKSTLWGVCTRVTVKDILLFSYFYWHARN